MPNYKKFNKTAYCKRMKLLTNTDGTISLSNENVTAALGYTPPTATDIKNLDTAKADKTALEDLEKAKAELADTNDKYLRVCAEYDNFRKRSAKERDGLYTDAYSDALKEVLPVIDNLERASQYTEPEKVADGLALIFKSASEMLDKLGVETH